MSGQEKNVFTAKQWTEVTERLLDLSSRALPKTTDQQLKSASGPKSKRD
jgi:hypothetical protein